MAVGMRVMNRIVLAHAISSWVGMCLGDTASHALATNVNNTKATP